MKHELAKNINEVVKPTDTLYHLGDWAFGGSVNIALFRYMINCKHVHLILGNHDRAIRNDPSLYKPLFESINEVLEIKTNKKKIVLYHYAMRVWNASHHGRWHLYGHSHGNLADDPHAYSMDVGVDANNYYPINFDDIKIHMDRKTFIPVDHHGLSLER